MEVHTTYTNSRMRNLIFALLAILLFLWPACAYDNDITQEIQIEVAGGPSAVTNVENAVSSAGSSVTLKAPTFQEVRDFILKDPTNRNKFILNQYECRHFATQVNNNAQTAGLRCAFVLICYDRGQHAVVAFDTTDRGLVYIEPQTDAAIHPQVGGKYQGKEITEILIAW